MNKALLNSIERTFFCGILAAVLIACSFQTLPAQDSITWYSMQQAQKLAKEHQKKVLIYAGASWCVYCQKMDQEVFPKQRVIDSLTAYYYGVRLDIESRRPMVFNGERMTQFRFARKHNVRATPTFFFVNSRGEIIGAQPGFIPADTFSYLLGYIGSDSYKKMEFGSYLKKYVRNK